MEKETHPSFGQIVHHVRRQMGFSQEELAFAAGVSQDTISRLEKGRHDPTNDTIHALRLKLGLEWTPLEPSERHRYRERLKEWLAVMEEGNAPLADDMKQKLSQIARLPHEGDLTIAYEVFELRWHLFKQDMFKAKECLDKLLEKKDRIPDFQKYYFYYNQGIFHMRLKKLELALESYLEAYQWGKLGGGVHAKVYYNIAHCYWELGYGGKAITFLNRLQEQYVPESLGALAKSVQNLMITCYINTFRYDGAKKLLDERLADIQQMPNNNEEMGRILFTYGHLYRKTEQYELAIEYFDKSLTHYTKDREKQMELLYQKIWCLLELGRPVGCIELLDEGKKLAEECGDTDWGQEYLMCFRALEAVSYIDSKSSRDFLENVAFPYFLEHEASYAIIDFYTCLIAYYRERDTCVVKTLDMMIIVYDRLDKMLEGGGLN